jgi:hypothetical protein
LPDSTTLTPASTTQTSETRPGILLPLCISLAMGCSLLVLNAALPLYGPWFHTSLLADLGSWILLPTHVLFPGRPLNPTLFHFYTDPPPSLAQSWQETLLLFILFSCILLIYLLALYILPQRISKRFILVSTLLFGIIYLLSAVVTSPDIFSYISYARMGTIYHLNPLTTAPLAIKDDPVFPHLYWSDQPSAYGPTWIILTCILQWLVIPFGVENVLPMVLALRLLGLLAHLYSVLLVWSIGGHLQRQQGIFTPSTRILATLAFAWNPLLLFEACLNAHNDTIVLLFVLLALWFLLREAELRTSMLLSATLLFALGTCLKINTLLLFPGLLLFLWTQPHRLQKIVIVLGTYPGVLVLLYIPFWQQGEPLVLLRVNPGTYRSINTLPDFITRIYNSTANLLGAPLASESGSPTETTFRTLSILFFVALYSLLCWRALHPAHSWRTPVSLLRSLTLTWLLYCALGTPWFWPWYTTLFFGLFSLLIAGGLLEKQKATLPAVALFSFSLLSLYCFFTWAPYASFIPGLPGFRVAFLRGLWAWFLPLLAFFAHKAAKHNRINAPFS